MQRPVPKWNQLRKSDQASLMRKGLNMIKFDNQSMDDELRLTVLTLYVKLNGLQLWNIMGSIVKVKPGCLEFFCDVMQLRKILTSSPFFYSPSNIAWLNWPSILLKEYWESQEKRYYGALHFKHFENWPTCQVEAHIDKVGWRGGPGMQPQALPVSGVHHWITKDDYKKPYIVREILLRQGWDPVPLLGVGVRTR
jgi:hypothetical protein